MSTPCPQCRHENSDTVEFCTQCHTRLRYACPACRHLQTQGDKCEACGVDFAAYETARLARLAAQRAQKPPANRTALAAIGILAALVVAGGVWWGVRSVSDTPKSSAPPAPVAAPPPPSPEADEARGAADSLRVLQNLRGLTQAKVNYIDYAQKALDARITVDRYAKSPGGDAELKGGMGEALELYLFAASAWNAGLRVNQQDEQAARAALASMANHPALALCPLLKAAHDGARGEADIPLEVAQGVAVAAGVPIIWACAAEKLAEVERRAPAQ